MKIRWPRLIVWFVFYFGLAWVFGKDAWWVFGAIVLHDILSFILDEWEKR